MATEYHQKTLSNLRVQQDYYTTKQVSEIYHVSHATACHWCRKGWLKADRDKVPGSSGRGGKWRIHPQQLEDIETTHRDELIELSRHYWIRLYARKIQRN
ncbi:MAG: hypothetical protein AUH05_13730 [Ktedonobacter sp. 13_2_20CM_53_11]|nr:MAG: hypothetical protein AUH05_13730 [Ktedonobacter sp. 13_2_20CM_53_11]